MSIQKYMSFVKAVEYGSFSKAGEWWKVALASAFYPSLFYDGFPTMLLSENLMYQHPVKFVWP